MLLGFTGFLQGFISILWVLLGFTGFYRVLLSVTGFYWVSRSFTDFDQVWLHCTTFYWVLLCFFLHRPARLWVSICRHGAGHFFVGSSSVFCFFISISFCQRKPQSFSIFPLKIPLHPTPPTPPTPNTHNFFFYFIVFPNARRPRRFYLVPSVFFLFYFFFFFFGLVGVGGFLLFRDICSADGRRRWADDRHFSLGDASVSTCPRRDPSKTQ